MSSIETKTASAQPQAPTRQRALKAAWELLENGASKVRMSDIAKAAGISRQALYLHFPNRADLLIATTRYIDEVNDIDALLAPSRAASSGAERLALFIDAWSRHLPNVAGVALALIAMQETDEEARKAWADRLAALRDGCQASIKALAADGQLNPLFDEKSATDLMMTALCVEGWAYLTRQCGWSCEAYRAHLSTMIERTFLAG